MDNSTALKDHVDMPMNIGHRIVPCFNQIWAIGTAVRGLRCLMA